MGPAEEEKEERAFIARTMAPFSNRFHLGRHAARSPPPFERLKDAGQRRPPRSPRPFPLSVISVPTIRLHCLFPAIHTPRHVARHPYSLISPPFYGLVSVQIIEIISRSPLLNASLIQYPFPPPITLAPSHGFLQYFSPSLPFPTHLPPIPFLRLCTKNNQTPSYRHSR